ncbi:uncharacterized protein LOC107265727 [Cephus cinctus]|uniref:Uncharacterized protein LOC107265727 n=1 Tax=Cephus cinctus TaxID=211228 RepID=A0AAJ7BP96_CEPCN|nr:uncharacterized protein LOC107265727 [Cephus cinctus]XP_015590956.1 uncharacterized protein LOC107265727 [Cephus cinctus]XP_015590957.1 uncharacterized protein LOC107265727 [Cephus cinctus]XP_024938751.1 uncharacterized protein LOC107265727 [Cephus cinctus]
MPKPGHPFPVKDLQAVLQRTLSQQLNILHIEWKMLTEPGENFGSLIIAVDVNMTRDSNPEILNIVVKLPPPTVFLRDLFNSPLTFKKELHFYENIVPAFIELQVENDIERDQLINLAPRYYGGRLGLGQPDIFDEQSCLVLENLNYQGFSTGNRIQGLDKEHMDYATKRLAQLHALMIGLKIKKPATFKKVISPALLSPINETTMDGVTAMVDSALAVIRSMPEAEGYFPQVEKVMKYSEEMHNSFVKGEEPWSTMVHHDFWVNNMLFKKDPDGKIIDLKIIDFQLYWYDVGITDLVFFMLSSAKKDVLDESLDDFIDLYYQSFLDCLELLKVNTKDFSRKSFDELLQKYAPTKFPQCIMMTQVIKADRSSTKEMDEIGNQETFLSNSSSKLIRNTLLHILKIFEKKGWFPQ